MDHYTTSMFVYILLMLIVGITKKEYIINLKQK